MPPLSLLLPLAALQEPLVSLAETQSLSKQGLENGTQSGLSLALAEQSADAKVQTRLAAAVAAPAMILVLVYVFS